MADPAARKETGASSAALSRRLIPLAVLAALAGLAIWFDLHKLLSFEQLVRNRDSLKAFVEANFLAAILLYMAIYVVVIALSLPGGLLLTVTGGFLFGWLVTGLATLVAATLGASILFLVARTALGEPLAARAGPWLDRLRHGFQEDALNYLLFLRLVPAFPFWLVNLAPALLGVPLATFIIGTFIGIVPGTFTFAFLGTGLDSIIDTQIAENRECLEAGTPCDFRFEPSALITTEILIAFAALGVIALIPVVVRKLRAHKHANPDS